MPQTRPPSYLEFQQKEAKKQKRRPSAGPPPFEPAQFPMGVPETAGPAPAPTLTPSTEEAPGFFGNLGIGAQRALLSVADAGRVMEEALSAASRGDFGPLGQIAELAGRGAAPIAAALSGRPEFAPAAFMTERAVQAPQIAELTRQREERMAAQPELFSKEAAAERARLDALAAIDPSLFGKITRRGAEFVTGAVPVVATGIATGGSVPAVAAVAGLQSLGQPENLVPAVALAAAPIPIGRVVAPLIRRIRGARAGAVEPVTAPVIEPEFPSSPTALPGPAGPRLPVRRAPVAPVPEGPGQPIPPPFVPAPAPPGIRPGNLPGPGGPKAPVLAAENPFTALETPPPVPAIAPAQSPALQSAIQKLGTDDVNQIGAIIESANRRFRLSSTDAERAASMEDFNIISQLTPDEETALAQVLPARTVSPIEPLPGPSGAGQARAISDIPLSEPNAQLDANLRELEAFFGAQAGQAEPRALAMTVGDSAFDGAKVKTSDLGLPSKFAPAESADAIPVRRVVKVDDLTLGRDDLSKGRMFQARESLNEGLKPGGVEFETPGGKKGVVTDIRVTPDPAEPGKFIVGGDGNHRAALLKLQGYTGDIPVVSMESPAQTAAMQLRGVPLNELEVAASRGAKISETRGPAIQQAQALQAGTLVAPVEKASLTDTLVSLWKAGLLTAVKTHIRNIGSNFGFQLSEEAARIPAAIADMVASLFTGRRTIGGLSPAAMARSAKDAATKGLRESVEILRRGVTDADAARLQLPQSTSGSKVVDAYVNGVFRTLSAEDRVFRTFAFRRALEDRAAIQVGNEVRRGITSTADRGARIRQLIANPDEALAANAASDAEVAVFTNPNVVSGAISAARDFLAGKGAGGKAAKVVSEILLPFDRTPTNIIARMINYSPIGFGQSAFQVAKGIANKAFTDVEQRAFAQTFGRATIGTALMALGWKLYDKGLMTGLYEDEPGKPARDVAAGRPPGAIRIGGAWHQLIGLAPLGNLMALGASLAREIEQQRTDEQGLPKGRQLPEALANIGQRTIEEQPLLQAAQTITQPGNLTERAGRLAGSVVPAAVSDVAQMADIRRQTRGEGFLGQIEARIPGLSQNLPPATDVLGRPLEDRFSRFIDPTLTSTARELREPLIRELIRLDMGLLKLQKKPSESSDNYLNRVRKFAAAYESSGLQLLNNPIYRSASDSDKRKYLTRLASNARSVVP